MSQLAGDHELEPRRNRQTHRKCETNQRKKIKEPETLVRGAEKGPAKGQNHRRKVPATPKKPDPPAKNDQVPGGEGERERERARSENRGRRSAVASRGGCEGDFAKKRGKSERKERCLEERKV